MKRILVVCLALVCLSSVAFAAKTPQKSAPKAAPASSGPLGAESIGLFANAVTPLVGMSWVYGNNLRGTYGLTFTSANNTSAYALFGRLDTPLAQYGPVQTYWGGQLTFAAPAANTTTITLSGLIGGEFALVKNVTLFADINVLNIVQTSANNASTTAFTVIGGPALAYSGFRLYF